MKVYPNWKRSKGRSIDANRYEIDITDDNGNDWYSLMYELDKRKEKYIVGVNKDKSISWFTSGNVAEYYAPSDGGTIVLINNFDESNLDLIFTGESFVEKPKPVIVERTKEDIMNDLISLQEELKAMK